MDAPLNPNPPAPNGPNDPLIVDDEPLPKKARVNENQSTREPSDVWGHFVKLQNREKSECKYCKKQYNATRRNGTSTMRAHLLKCKKIPGVIDRSQTTLIFQAKKTCVLRESLIMSLLLLNFLLREFGWLLHG